MGYHYVPQEYLKGFADPSNPDRLWQFDKKVQIYSKAALPIDQIAQSRDFYDAKTEDELNRLVERPRYPCAYDLTIVCLPPSAFHFPFRFILSVHPISP
jgi:hypothetical protein